MALSTGLWCRLSNSLPFPPLFHNLWQFNVKVAAAHHPIIQKEVDELLSKGAVEPSSGGAGFYSSVFVILSIMLALAHT